MGAWGAGHFENDDALDWVWSLEADDDASAIREALDAIARPSGKVEATDECCALAAATVVAAAIGRPTGEQLPAEAATWLQAHGSKVGGDLVALARQAVDRVKAGSELRELWRDEDPTEWLKTVDELQSRLRAGTRARKQRRAAEKPTGIEGTKDTEPATPSPPRTLFLRAESDAASIAPRVAAMADRGEIHVVELDRLPLPGEVVAELASALAARPDLQLTVVAEENVSLEWIAAAAHVRRLSVRTGTLDLSPLGELHELRELSLGTGSLDLSPLGELHELRELRLEYRELALGNGQASLSFLSGTPLLETLTLTQGRDFEAVAGLVRLRSLEITHGSLTTFDFLTGHPALEGLKISWLSRRIRDLTPLPTIPKLRLLDLTGVPGVGTADFAALGDCPSLIWLRAAGLDEVEDLAALAQRPAETLRFLELFDMTGLTTLSHLAACGRLEEASLKTGSRPADQRLADIAAAPALTYLEVWDEYPETEIEAVVTAFRGRCFDYRGKYLVGSKKSVGLVGRMAGAPTVNTFYLAVLDAGELPAEFGY